MNGKGDGNRTADHQAYRSNYDRIFRRKPCYPSHSPASASEDHAGQPSAPIAKETVENAVRETNSKKGR